MVITLVGKDATERILRSGLSLFGRKFKAQHYLSFSPDSQCSRCLAFGHHPTQCTSTIHCAICTQEHPIHLHSYGRALSALPGVRYISTPLSSAITATNPTQQPLRSVPPISIHSRQPQRGEERQL
ncbi:hypothetical protein L873DRAFT_1819785, partial [Choiromyces venosus 120613-1]